MDGTPASLLARLYQADALLAYLLEVILKLQEMQPDLAWFCLIESAKKRGEMAAAGQPVTQES